ncbi:hypothetical protein QYF36_026341 [Acer negundo]|nr:hypothetical protein QYF36_026341 [Acer negundo]
MGLAHAQDSPQDFVNAHNAARSEVGVGTVTWDDQVAAYAQNYANQRTQAVQMWVNEKSDYDYNSNTCAPGKVCGHYTQVVWRNSVRIGCAKVSDRLSKEKAISAVYSFDLKRAFETAR